MKQIEVHYTVELDDADFKRALSLAEERGLDYNDAGKMETVKRLLIDEGVQALPERDFGLVRYTRN